MADETLELALTFAERWPLMLGTLKYFATSNDDAPHFVTVIQALNEQLKAHSLAILTGSDSLTEVATRIGTNVRIGNKEYPSASDAALALSNNFMTDIWKAIDLLAVSRAVSGDKTVHFDPETAGTPAHWPNCREAVAKFFDGGWWQAETLGNLGIAVGRERVAMFPPQPAALAGGDGTGDELQKRIASLERHRKKHTKPLTKTEKTRNQRIKFCCPRRRKNPPDTWNEIYHDYAEKFPNDKTASPDSLLHSHDRNCLKCREQKS